MNTLSDTGYPVGMRLIDCAYREVLPEIVGCGGNLDAPVFIVTGGVFWAPLCNEALPILLPRGIR
jgi:hypothetical protein